MIHYIWYDIHKHLSQPRTPNNKVHLLATDAGPEPSLQTINNNRIIILLIYYSISPPASLRPQKANYQRFHR